MSEQSTITEQTSKTETESEETSYVTIIEPSNGWQLINAQELWRYRELLYYLAWRDIKIRYKQTVLGAAWAILQPALMMIVFTIIFGRITKVDTGNLPYPLFVLPGLLPWSLFATAMTQAANSVVGSERLITKIYFPRLLVPFGATGAALMDFVTASSLLALMMAWYYSLITLSWTILLLPVIVLFIWIAALGLGIGLAALNVTYRDFRYVIPFLIQLGMYATPAIYMDVTKLQSEPWVHTVLAFNPMNGLISAFRAALFSQPMDWGNVLLSMFSVLVLFVLGCLYFRKAEDRFADVI